MFGHTDEDGLWEMRLMRRATMQHALARTLKASTQLYGVTSAFHELLSLHCCTICLDYSGRERLILKLKQLITSAEKQAGGRLCFPFL